MRQTAAEFPALTPAPRREPERRPRATPAKGTTADRVVTALVDHIRIDEKWTANVTFGGKDRQTLFITASTSLYSIRLRVRGANASK